MIVEAFNKLDVYYDYTDDARVWRQGRDAHDAFTTFIKKASREAREEAERMLKNEYDVRRAGCTDVTWEASDLGQTTMNFFKV